MNAIDFPRLSRGDILGHKNSALTYVVMGHYGTRVTVARNVDITNPPEWLHGSDRSQLYRVSQLRAGDTVHYRGSTVMTALIVVTAVYGNDHATAVSTLEITKSDLEGWELINPHGGAR
ncbi:MAG: hypothetical protein RLZZ324_1021 [Candidatus Parcubacteria bacterium]|jgi:hypothetical protein